jgi:hypothetical protein
MLYKFNRHDLTFRPVVTLRGVATASVVAASLLGIAVNTISNVDEIIYEDILHINVTERAFTEARLVEKIQQLNIRFPHIALAQAKLESGGYESKIFQENKNLYGMKEARVRINVATGTSRGHATYSHWEDSVTDYAFWCATYASQCKTEEQFYALLARYAEDVRYEAKLREVIERDGLRDFF